VIYVRTLRCGTIGHAVVTQWRSALPGIVVFACLLRVRLFSLVYAVGVLGKRSGIALFASSFY